MVADLLIANLLRIAREDLDGASVLAPRGNRNAAYLCEQAAEKVIRAVLTSEGKHAGIRHQLDEMVNLVPDENPLKPALREIEQLAAYATACLATSSKPSVPIPLDGACSAHASNKVIWGGSARLHLETGDPQRLQHDRAPAADGHREEELDPPGRVRQPVREHEHLDALSAMAKAGPLRLRPILMTTVATMMAAVPAVLGIGPGTETRSPMAAAVLGGLTVSTLLSLLVVPAFYVVSDRLKRRLLGRATAAIATGQEG